ncbi:MAG: CrcB family protein [Planctomycetota bacterium]
MSRVLPILMLAAGGAAGTLARVGLAAAVQRFHGGTYPWGTFAANAAGCFLFGLFFAVLDADHRLGPVARLALLGGFCGAFTTFSTFAFDTANLHSNTGLLHALGNLLLHNAVGLTLVFLGLALGGRLVPPPA